MRRAKEKSEDVAQVPEAPAPIPADLREPSAVEDGVPMRFQPWRRSSNPSELEKEAARSTDFFRCGGRVYVAKAGGVFFIHRDDLAAADRAGFFGVEE